MDQEGVNFYPYTDPLNLLSLIQTDFSKSISYIRPSLWAILPLQIRTINDHLGFKSAVKNRVGAEFELIEYV